LKKADLHVHSKFSNHPSYWFLQRLGARESYTEPDYIYQTAKKQGMDYVTITDHNRIDGSLYLKEKYPEEVFTGVEATTYFPEDGCKVHILIYGLTANDFIIIEKTRQDIYQLRDFIRERDLTYSIAHATFSVNGRLKIEHVEKLVLLFNIFESINGGRNQYNNHTWAVFLKHLQQDYFEKLQKKHRIKPWGPRPWVKGFTGGSDDHAGLFIGQTYTTLAAKSPADFLARIKQKSGVAQGRHNDYQALAFTIYKIANDFIKTRSKKLPNVLLQEITENIYSRSSSNFMNNLQWLKLKYARRNGDQTRQLIISLIEKLKNGKPHSLEDKFTLVYDKIADLTDELIKQFLWSIQRSLKEEGIFNIIQNFSAFLPSVFLSIPFFSSLKYMHNTRHISAHLENFIPTSLTGKSKSVLWFTDTLNDLNGVSITLQKIGQIAQQSDRDIHIVTALPQEEMKFLHFSKLINLPYIYEFKLPYYESYILRIPSILKAIAEISRYEPDKIIISTPGPLGFLGILVANLLQIKSIGVYHTDFTMQAKEITANDDLLTTIESGTKWFYSLMDEIRVPTYEYMDILERRGADRSKMKLFRRGIDIRQFAPRKNAKHRLENCYKIPTGFNLLFSGRLSKDKSLDFLVEVYANIVSKYPNTNLIIAGDGPYLAELQQKTTHLEKVFLLGKVSREKLPPIYSGCDLFVFPSTTDTFGMVVLEAQACGLPALVTDIGGPKEIVIPGKTGAVLPAGQLGSWTAQIGQYIQRLEQTPEQFAVMRRLSRQLVAQNCDWNTVLDDLITDDLNQVQDQESIPAAALQESRRPVYQGNGTIN